MDIVGKLATIFIVISAFAYIVFMLATGITTLDGSYKYKISVDSPEKIEYAISNAVNIVKSKDFVVIGLDVHIISKNRFSVVCKGIEKENLLDL